MASEAGRLQGTLGAPRMWGLRYETEKSLRGCGDGGGEAALGGSSAH